MNTFLNSNEVFISIVRWKWHLVVIAVVSALASIIFSGPAFIKPKFKSYAIVYPSNLITYSTESATEQMLQLFQSSDVRDQIIRSMNLISHYEIDTVKNDHIKNDVIKVYEDNVEIKKTEYESVEIKVWDTDPAFASSIIDSIIHFGDLKARSLQRAKTVEIYTIVKKQYDLKKAEMDSMENQLKEYRTKYGLLDYVAQVKEYSRAYENALIANSSRGASEAKAMLNTLAQYGGDYFALTENIWRVRGTYNDLKINLENTFKDMTKELTYANVVTKPFPSDKKASPIRWLIVVVSVGTSMLIAFLMLFLFQSTMFPQNKKA